MTYLMGMTKTQSGPAATEAPARTDYINSMPTDATEIQQSLATAATLYIRMAVSNDARLASAPPLALLHHLIHIYAPALDVERVCDTWADNGYLDILEAVEITRTNVAMDELALAIGEGADLIEDCRADVVTKEARENLAAWVRINGAELMMAAVERYHARNPGPMVGGMATGDAPTDAMGTERFSHFELDANR